MLGYQSISVVQGHSHKPVCVSKNSNNSIAIFFVLSWLFWFRKLQTAVMRHPGVIAHTHKVYLLKFFSPIWTWMNKKGQTSFWFSCQAKEIVEIWIRSSYNRFLCRLIIICLCVRDFWIFCSSTLCCLLFLRSCLLKFVIYRSRDRQLLFLKLWYNDFFLTVADLTTENWIVCRGGVKKIVRISVSWCLLTLAAKTRKQSIKHLNYFRLQASFVF